MIRVLEGPQIFEVKKQTQCTSCHAKLEYSLKDIQEVVMRKAGAFDTVKRHRFIRCPVCDTILEHELKEERILLNG